MSQPPYDPYRRSNQPPRPPQRPYPPSNRPAQPGRYPQQQQGGYQREEYRRQPPPPRRVEPERPSRGLPGIGLVLALIGTAVQLLSLTVLPWITLTSGGSSQSLLTTYRNLTDGGAHGFGDWYVVVFSYPLAILGVLLAFAAVLESVAMKVVWGGLVLIGLGFLLLRYGFGPLTGTFGGKSGAMEFSTVDIVLALVALVAVVVVIFALKMAVSMFRRIAGVILIVLSGVHLAAVMDLVNASDLSELSVGAFGPSVGYLLIGIAALIGPRRVIPGL